MCANDVQKALEDFSVQRVLFLKITVVKFNDDTDILNEGDTQKFVYDALKSLPDAPPVPEVYDCFSWNGIRYLVMEKVDLPTSRSLCIRRSCYSLFFSSPPPVWKV